MKIKFMSVFSAIGLCLALFSSGCALSNLSPQQTIALATSAAGSAFATYELDKDGKNVTALQHIAAELPKIPSGEVTPFEIGALQAELQSVKLAVGSSNQQFSDQLTSLLALVSQANAQASGGNVTVNQALMVAALQNVSNGITLAVQVWQGKQSVINPPPSTN